MYLQEWHEFLLSGLAPSLDVMLLVPSHVSPAALESADDESFPCSPNLSHKRPGNIIIRIKVSKFLCG